MARGSLAQWITWAPQNRETWAQISGQSAKNNPRMTGRLFLNLRLLHCTLCTATFMTNHGVSKNCENVHLSHVKL